MMQTNNDLSIYPEPPPAASLVQGRAVSILLVEDNEGDVFLIQKTFERARLQNNLIIATDGRQALEMIYAKPDIIFLDINLPGLNGIEILKQIKSDPALQSIPVIIMTGSPAELDILKTQNLDAAAYVIKPLTIESLGSSIKTLRNFWFGILDVAQKDTKKEKGRFFNMQTQLRERYADTPVSNIIKEFEDFAYIVSHDLNTPLRHLKQFVGLLLKNNTRELDSDEKKYVYYIQKSIERLDDMQAALLIYSRINTRSQAAVRISANELVQGALNALSPQISEYNPTIKCDDLPMITVDPHHIQGVFFHLLSNALKFHRNDAQRKISISAAEDGNALVFRIRDNGIGIESGYLEEVFKMFRRLHTAEEYPGIGAGLTLAKKIVERHKGKIWIESEPAKGTSAYFTLPKTR